MSRYIDADALCKLARNHVDGTVDCNDIMRFPTVDAVPVVRCRECAHYETAGCKDGYGWCNARVVDSTGVCDDFYCADGERRTE